MKRIKQILTGGAKQTTKHGCKKKWSLTTTLFLWILATTGTAARTDPASITITPDGSTAGQNTTAITATQGTEAAANTWTFTLEPNSTFVAAQAGYNKDNYKFTFPSLAGTITPTVNTANWLHTFTVADAHNEATAVAITNVSYGLRVGITATAASTGKLNTTVGTVTGNATTAGLFTFTVTKNLGAGIVDNDNFKWTAKVNSTDYNFETPAVTGLTLAKPTEAKGSTSYTWTVQIDYNLYNSANPIAIEVDYTETPIAVALAAGTGAIVGTATADNAGLATVAAYTTGSTQGKYGFTVAPTTTAPASEPEDTKEPKFEIKTTTGETPVSFTIVDNIADAGATGLYLAYDYTASSGPYNVTVVGITTPITITVSYTDKPKVTATITPTTANGNKISALAPTAGTATGATRGSLTITPTIAETLTGHEWVFTTGNGATALNANTTPKVVGTYNASGTGHTIQVDNVTADVSIALSYALPPIAVADTVKTTDNLGTVGSGIKNVTTPTRTNGTFQFNFKATIKDEYATGGTFKVYKVTTTTDPNDTETELTAGTTGDYTVTQTDENRTYNVTILKALPDSNKYAVQYSGAKLASQATFQFSRTEGSHPFRFLSAGIGNIVEGKFNVIVKPTYVPRQGTEGSYTLYLTTDDKVGDATVLIAENGTVTVTGSGEDATRKITVHKSEPNEEEVDTFSFTNVTFTKLNVEIKYVAPTIKVTHEKAGLVKTVPIGSPISLINDGTDVYKTGTAPDNITEGFTVVLDDEALENYKGEGKFSFVVAAKLDGDAAYTALAGPVVTYEQNKNAQGELIDYNYTVYVTGLKYVDTKITVGYDTIPAEQLKPEPPTAIPSEKVKEKKDEAVAVIKTEDPGEIIAYKNTEENTWLGVTDEQKDQFVQKGTIIPGEKLATTINIEPAAVSPSPQYVQLSFTGPLSIIPPLKVKDVYITSVKFKVVYVFESSTNSGLRTRAETDTWAEFDAVNEILYVHLVDMDVAVLGDAPSYAQLAPINVVNDAEKVGQTIGQSEWAVTLYEHPINLIPDNGVPGTNYPGYFILEGTYPTDGQLRYKIEGDAAWKPFYTSITTQEIERLANGELLFFAYANYQNVTDNSLDGALADVYIDARGKGLDGANGVGAYIYIYKPKTYATTGENPVVVPRPYAIVAATTNTVALGFSRTAGTTTTGEFTFKVTPEEVLTNGELDFTFTKKGGGTVNPLPAFDPGKPDIDGAFSVRIYNIKVSDIVITVEYKQGVGVEEVSTSKVWSYGKTLFISSTSNGTAKIYSLTGQLVKTVNVNTGVTITELPTGIYLVNTADGKIHKVGVK
jgi:hypothetical protein